MFLACQSNKQRTQTALVQGTTTEPESIGTLCWAPLGGRGNVLWPAEMIDAAAIPRGRSIPKDVLKKLNESDRHVLRESLQGTPIAASAERMLIDGLHAPVPEDVMPGARKKVVPKMVPSKKSYTGRQCQLPKHFVTFFGTAEWCWLPVDQLISYFPNKQCAPHLRPAGVSETTISHHCPQLASSKVAPQCRAGLLV